MTTHYYREPDEEQGFGFNSIPVSIFPPTALVTYWQQHTFKPRMLWKCEYCGSAQKNERVSCSQCGGPREIDG